MKKTVTIFSILFLLTIMTVTAFAFPDPSGNKEAWTEANNFAPLSFEAAKVNGTIDIDGAVTPDLAYGSSRAIVVDKTTDYGGLNGEIGATGVAYAAWDNEYIYLHFNIADTTKGIGYGFTADSVDILLDYDQQSDGKKVKWNKLSSSDTFSGQYRVQRGGNRVDIAVCGNSAMTSVGERASVAVVENGTAGYVVEAKFPLLDENGIHIPVSNTIGFSLMINDSTDGDYRDSAAYTQGGIQYYLYEYTHLFDNLVLIDNENHTWSTRSIKTDINTGLATYNPYSSYFSKAPTSRVSSAARSSRVSSVAASRVSSVAASRVSSVASMPSHAHFYDNDCDANCNGCGASRTVPDHIYDNDCDANCNGCGASRTVPDHIYDNDSDTNCNICNYVREVALEGWVLDGANWLYYINNAKVTGWQYINNTWYYFNTDGVMQTGWQYLHGTWYYFGAGGNQLFGWQNIGGTWYYFNDGGAMLTGWQSIGGTWYYFGASGNMLTGWLYVNGTWYYLAEGGNMVTGWQYINNTWYYFNDGGAMLTGWQSIGGTWYYFGASGNMLTGWLYVNGTWYYLSEGGAMLTGWQLLGSNWYYFNEGGAWVA